MLFTLPFYLSFIVYLFYIEPNLSGDLGHLGKIPFGKEYNKNIEENYLEKLKVSTYTQEDNNTHEIMAIGDSFTPTSKNSYLNYLAHNIDKQIVNLPRKGDIGPEQTAVFLLKNGFFATNQTEVLILESVERYFLFGLIYIDFEKDMEVDDVLNLKPSSKSQLQKKSKKNYLNELSSWYRLSLGCDNPVYKANLSDSLFSIKNKKLYFYKDDFLSLNIPDEEIDFAKNNLRKLDSMFRTNGIDLIYVVASDKYDLYQDYIINNSYPKINVMEKFQGFEKEPFFFNTQTVLKPLLKDKTKDVYLANDSHWSYIATRAVGEELSKRIIPLLDK
jgi:hypothetical protein